MSHLTSNCLNLLYLDTCLKRCEEAGLMVIIMVCNNPVTAEDRIHRKQTVLVLNYLILFWCNYIRSCLYSDSLWQ